MAIKSFETGELTEYFYTGKIPKKCNWANIKSVAKRKLDMIDYAEVLTDLKAPPGNRLEELKGRLKGWHSIRVNDQWRITFIWTDQGASRVNICYYHN